MKDLTPYEIVGYKGKYCYTRLNEIPLEFLKRIFPKDAHKRKVELHSYVESREWDELAEITEPIVEVNFCKLIAFSEEGVQIRLKEIEMRKRKKPEVYLCDKCGFWHIENHLVL
jgi:hypothetical protein